MVTRWDIALASNLAETLRRCGSDSRLFCTLMGPNAFGAGLMGEQDPRMEQVLERIESGLVHALIMVETDVWYRFPERRRLLAALDRLELSIVLDYTAPLERRADVFLPTQTIFETGGHWVNQEGRLQRAHPIFMGGEPIIFSGAGGIRRGSLISPFRAQCPSRLGGSWQS